MANFLSNPRSTLLGLLLLSLSITSCQQAPPAVAQKTTPFKVGAWVTVNKKTDTTALKSLFSKLENAGFNEILINTGTNAELLEQVAPMAKAQKLNVHAWMFTMNRPGDPVAKTHPDWYTVSRDGKSCYDDQPYVNYYQWLCPSRPDAVAHVLSLVQNLAQVPNVESVHLDYIRFVDVFLPIGLLPKYGIIQNTERPEYDFCYCDVCRAKFNAAHHRDPLELDHPELDVEWRQFRLNAIREVVNKAYRIAHNNGKILTAAVFPYPTMAANMVRQRWDKWDVDRVYPMLYHNFYNEGTDWVSFATAQGVADLKGKNTALSAGVYVPALQPEELPQLIQRVKAEGAAGITFFSANALSDAHLKAIQEALKNP